MIELEGFKGSVPLLRLGTPGGQTLQGNTVVGARLTWVHLARRDRQAPTHPDIDDTGQNAPFTLRVWREAGLDMVAAQLPSCRPRAAACPTWNT